MTKENVKLEDGYTQVCVWPSTIVGQDKIAEFEKFVLDNFKTRVRYLEEIKTKPDTANGRPVEDTGDRNDLFFAVHCEDVAKFAVPRLAYGIKWIEDVLAKCNYRSPIYPKRVFNYL